MAQTISEFIDLVWAKSEVTQICNLVSALRPEWAAPHFFVGGASASMFAAITTFEERSNRGDVGVLARSRTAGLALLALLRIVVDKHDLNTQIAKLLDRYATVSVRELVTHNKLSPAAPRIVLVLAASEADHATMFAPGENVVRRTVGLGGGQTFSRQLDELDVWTMPRICAALKPRITLDAPRQICEALRSA